MTWNAKKKKKCIERKIRQNVNLSDSEMIDWGTNAKNAEINFNK